MMRGKATRLTVCIKSKALLRRDAYGLVLVHVVLCAFETWLLFCRTFFLQYLPPTVFVDSATKARFFVLLLLLVATRSFCNNCLSCHQEDWHLNNDPLFSVQVQATTIPISTAIARIISMKMTLT